MTHAWPVEVRPVGAVTTGSLLWRVGGALHATVVVKATFDWVPGGEMRVAAPRPVTRAVRYEGAGDRAFAVEADDVAPFRAEADVTFVGRAHGGGATSRGVRVAVYRSTALVDKTLHVYGPRATRRDPPGLLESVPLSWDRAAFGPDNPAGVRDGTAQIIDPDAPERPAGFGPLSPQWPERARHLGPHTRLALAGEVVEIPDDFAWRFYQAAPAGQRCAYLQGDEWVVLDGVDPELPRVQTRLPGRVGLAVAWPSTATRADQGFAVAMVADQLVIDGEARQCSVVWRGSFPVASREVLDALWIAATVAPRGQAVDWDDALAARPGVAVAGPAHAAVEVDRRGTMVLASPVERGAGPAWLRFAAGPRPPPPARASAPPSAPPSPTPAGPAWLRFAAGPRPPPPSASTRRAEPEASAERAPARVAPQRTVAADAAGLARDAGPSWLRHVVGARPPAPAPPPVTAAPLAAPTPAPPAPAPSWLNRIAGPRDSVLQARRAARATQTLDGPAQAPASALPAWAQVVAPGDRRVLRPIALPGAPWSDAPAPLVVAGGGGMTITTMAPAWLGEAPHLDDLAQPLLVSPEDAPAAGAAVRFSRHGEGVPLHNPTSLSLVTRSWRRDRTRYVLTIVAKATCDLVDGGPAVLHDQSEHVAADAHEDNDPARPLLRAGDHAVFKPLADITLTGTAHAPSRAPVTQMRVALSLGEGDDAITRELTVTGDRRWLYDRRGVRPSSPEPFTSMPLRWSRCYGGPTLDDNPHGVGHEPSAERPMLPNLELAGDALTRPDQVVHVAALGPLSPSHPTRARLGGTFDDAWQRERWPCPPADRQESFEQVAPPAQRRPYLRGDEPFVLEGLDAERPTLRGALPGLRVRCFAQHTTPAGGDFVEVAMRLDTAHFDTDQGSLALVWRGVMEVRDDEASGVAWVVLHSEPLAAEPAPRERVRRRFVAVVAADQPVLDSPAGMPAAANLEAAPSGRQVGFAAPTGVAPVGGFVGGIGRDAASTATGLAEGARGSGASPPGRGASEPARRSGPSPESVAGVLAKDGALDGCDLAGADLRGIDFSGRSLVEADLAGADLRGANLGASDLSRARLGGADLSGARLDEATLEGADLHGACLRDASLRGARLGGADLSAAQAARANLAEVSGAGVRLGDADWSGASFAAARLAAPDFSGSVLEGAAFDDASLRGARLYDVRAERASFRGTDLTEARGDGATLSGGTLEGMRAPSSAWEGAAFDGARMASTVLSKAVLNRCSLRETDLGGADLRRALLTKAALPGARLAGANLMEATLDGADLTGADLRGANLYGADTYRAAVAGAVLDGALLDGTSLAKDEPA